MLSSHCEAVLSRLEEKVRDTYNDELWEALKAALAVIACLSMRQRSNPLTLIFEGASGRGKSTIINMCEPDRDSTKAFLYRLDKFTPAAFVTQAANVSRDSLSEVDLLPKLRNKVLLVKELAPLFRGREEALRENFSTLTAVLDGKGHKTASGTHGTRGYDGKFVFNWIGGTTPIPASTDAVMAQLGNRLLRYEIIGQEQSEEELMRFLNGYDAVDAETECRKLVNDFIEGHFQGTPVDTVEPVKFDDSVSRQLVRLALLVCQGRVEVQAVTVAANSEFIAGSPEGPNRVLLLMKTFLQGLMLVGGKEEPDGDLLCQVRHVAFSSIPQRRRQLLRAVLSENGKLDSPQAERVLGLSAPAVRERMAELAATGLVVLRKQSGLSHKIELAEPWSWLRGSSGDTVVETKMPVCGNDESKRLLLHEMEKEMGASTQVQIAFSGSQDDQAGRAGA